MVKVINILKGRRLQKENGFNIDVFAQSHRLLKITFVRHPLERYVLNSEFTIRSFSNATSDSRLISAYESKVIDDPDSTDIYQKMVQLYNSTSFQAFARHVLDSAEEKKCYDVGSRCNINVHLR